MHELSRHLVLLLGDGIINEHLGARLDASRHASIIPVDTHLDKVLPRSLECETFRTPEQVGGCLQFAPWRQVAHRNGICRNHERRHRLSNAVRIGDSKLSMLAGEADIRWRWDRI